MKNLKVLFYLIFIIFVVGCNGDGIRVSESESGENSAIIGKWQLVKSSYSTGTSEQLWQEVENGYVLNLKKNKTFESDKIKNSTGGTYEIKGNDLILNFNGSIEPSEYIEHFSVSEDTLMLQPVSPYMCTEGCSSLLKRID